MKERKWLRMGDGRVEDDEGKGVRMREGRVEGEGGGPYELDE